jgi:hypothetical protein
MNDISASKDKVVAYNSIICEANYCSKKAISEIKLDVGKFGQISLYLCDECIPKFDRKSKRQ